jgi:hypothetical protein
MKAMNVGKKYAATELADSFVFRSSLKGRQKEVADQELTKARAKVQAQVSEKQVLYGRILQLRFQMEDYVRSERYDPDYSFSFFLKQYIKLRYKMNKDFARDIDLEETELSLILNNHRSPSEKIITRLGLHSGDSIPALSWYRIVEKEREHMFLTNKKLVQTELRFVKNRLQVDF